MGLGHLLSLNRFRQCRRIFFQPMKAHLLTGRSGQGAYTLSFKEGGTVECANPRQTKKIFRWLLNPRNRVDRIWALDGKIAFRCMERTVAIRPAYLDLLVYIEIFHEDQYGLNGITPPLGTVVDLGANIGLFSLRIAPSAERIIAVEAVSENLDLARLNLSNNRLDGKVELVHGAVAAGSGEEISVHLNRNNPGGHSIQKDFISSEEEVEKIAVTSISLDDLFDQHRISRCDLLKCDIEGAEYEAFLNASSETLGRIRRIVMEYHDLPGSDSSQVDALVRRLNDAGFKTDLAKTPVLFASR